MKTFYMVSLVVVWAMIPSPPSLAQQPPPNFILILTDDQGWSSTSIGMDDRNPDSKSDYFETPHFDRLARGGMRFTQAYSPASICSPSRRSILLGQTPVRLGDETFKDKYDPKKNKPPLTIPLLLKSLNKDYRAAHFGKWDLRADIFPEDMGYDESDGDTRNAHGNLMSDNHDKWADIFVNDDPKRAVSVTRRAINFMERQVKDRRPFYLQVSHYAPHVDIQTREATLNKYQNKAPGKIHQNPGWAGMLEDMDATVGEILDKVEGLGISDNTYIIFMADNGGVELLPPVPAKNKLLHPDTFDRPTRNYPLRGGKWTLYEGGLRVPFVVKGPGVAAGKMSHVPVGGWDILPTIAELVGYDNPLPKELDGGSFADLIRNSGKGSVSRANDFFIFHRYHNSYPHTAIIKGAYKLLVFWKTGEAELYDINTEIGERNNLIEKERSQAQALYQLLTAYIKNTNAELLKEMLSYQAPDLNE